MDRPVWFDSLSKAERAALTAYARHWSYKGAARDLGKSVRTIEKQLADARLKMGATTSGEASMLFVSVSNQIMAMGSPIDVPSSAEEFGEDPSFANSKSEERQAGRHKRYLLLAGFSVLLVLIVTAAMQLTSARIPAQRYLRHTDSEVKEAFQELDGLGKAGISGDTLDPGAENKRAQMIAKLCMFSWDDLYTGRYEFWEKELEHREGALTRAFEWSIKNNPQLALDIIGSSHRYLNAFASGIDWRGMLDRAVKAAPDNASVGMGRTLCGIALVQWNGEPNRGLEAAARAVGIFQSLNRPEDLAEAKRHLGLCLNADWQRQWDCYFDAIRICEGMKESPPRILAMTYQSLGQRSGPPKMSTAAHVKMTLDEIAYLSKSIELFHQTGDRLYAKESATALDRKLHQIPSDSTTRPMRNVLREFLAGEAKADLAADRMSECRALGARCLELDLDTSNWDALDYDLKTILDATWSLGYSAEIRRSVFGGQDLGTIQKNIRSNPTLRLPADQNLLSPGGRQRLHALIDGIAATVRKALAEPP